MAAAMSQEACSHPRQHFTGPIDSKPLCNSLWKDNINCESACYFATIVVTPHGLLWIQQHLGILFSDTRVRQTSMSVPTILHQLVELESHHQWHDHKQQWIERKEEGSNERLRVGRVIPLPAIGSESVCYFPNTPVNN
jgi:hypothetical protein